MATIDGLITGIDTTSVIEGLLEIRKAQITRLEGRKAEIISKQTSFSGVESRLLSLRATLGRLTNVRNNAVQQKSVTSSNEDIITAGAGSSALTGVYQLSVEQLATSHAVSTDALFEGTDATITTGTISIRVGNGSATTITVDNTNNTLQGLADTINASDAGVNATIVRSNEGATPYKLVLTSKKSGEDNRMTITDTLGASSGGAIKPNLLVQNPTNDPPPAGSAKIVDPGNNARVKFGTGAGAITGESQTNQIDELIPGVTLDLHTAKPGEIVTLTVGRDLEAAKETIDDMVKAYNDVITYVNTQTEFVAETGRAGQLLGDRTVSDVRDQVQFAITSVVAGVNKNLNRLSAVGITIGSNGTLALNSDKLDDALNGRVEGVEADDVLRLFALAGESSSSGMRFLGGSARTKTGTFQVEITSAATQATTLATNAAAASTVINATNNTFKLSLDGELSNDLTIANGTYTVDGLAAALEQAINGDDKLIGREVNVSVQGGKIQIRSLGYGSSSKISAISGSAIAALGFSGSEIGQGADVKGHFIVNGKTEKAIGSGQLLSGDAKNDNTADVQLRVTLNSTQLNAGTHEGTIDVTRGIASHLDKVLADLLETGAGKDSPSGRIETANDRYDELVADIDESIKRMNERFDAEQESLIKQFTALETAVSGFQNTASFLSSQLASTGGLRVR